MVVMASAASAAQPLDRSLLAAIAEMAVVGPSAARSWCLVARDFSEAFGFCGMWAKVVADVQWPLPSTHKAGVLAALARLGRHCRRLGVDGLRGGVEDLPSLSKLCPSVQAADISGIGVQGVDPEVWCAWGPSLRRLRLAFFYDACDGPPALRRVLRDVVERCPDLEDLAVAGMDWLSAGEACLAALTEPSAGHPLPRLKRLELAGCEALLKGDATSSFARLVVSRPGLALRITARPAPNLDW